MDHTSVRAARRGWDRGALILPAEIQRNAERFAPVPAPILITGERGTGKSTLARWIHGASPWSGGPFITADCAAIPEPLIDSELFGHVRGAFTGARTRRRGLARKADGGTLFLDEISVLPLSGQGRLLRLLQEETVRPVGSDDELKASARVIIATNSDLEAMAREGTFRADLHDRCRTLELRLPPLRERTSEFPALVDALVADIRRRELQGFAMVEPPLTLEAVAILSSGRWPGNLRELRIALVRLLIDSRGRQVGAEHFSPRFRRASLAEPRSVPADAGKREDACPSEGSMGSEVAVRARPRYEPPADRQEKRRVIVEAPSRTAGNRRAAARLLGMARSTRYGKLGRFGIEDQDRQADIPGWGVRRSLGGRSGTRGP